jgi:ADP-ribose pyrophosphatase YjhB (NUDIX family)
MTASWLDWAARLQAIAQNGLEYAANPFDVERYQAVRRVAAEMLAAGSGVPIDRVLERWSGELGYATPKVDVRGVVFQDDALLLVKERSDHCWTLPGGWAEVGLSPAENVEREVFEESGYQTRAVKVLAVYDRRKHPHLPPHPLHIYKIFFLCQLTGGAAGLSAETEGAAFFREDDIPELSSARVTPAQIGRMFDHRRHPEWPADFD